MRDKIGKNGKKTASPFDFLKRSTEYASEQLSGDRYKTCEECPKFTPLTKQCKMCGCFMHLKTKLLHAECPMGKW